MRRFSLHLTIGFLLAIPAAAAAQTPRTMTLSGNGVNSYNNIERNLLEAAEKMPDKTKELHAKMIAWREAIKAPMPAANTDIKPAKPGKGQGRKKESD